MSLPIFHVDFFFSILNRLLRRLFRFWPHLFNMILLLIQYKNNLKIQHFKEKSRCNEENTMILQIYRNIENSKEYWHVFIHISIFFIGFLAHFSIIYQYIFPDNNCRTNPQCSQNCC